MISRDGKKGGSECFRWESISMMRAPMIQAELAPHFIRKTYALPVYSSKVQAGFPSPADEYIQGHLDLNSKFIRNPSATFVVQATGDSMTDAGIFSGDWLLVDKSLDVADGNIVIAAINGELTVKRLSRTKGRVQLLSANPKFPPIDITEEMDLVIWGVVTCVFHELL
ncbi:MAG: translesion error-prone DNA polymerase V autoproteolytic subunit [Legionella sp.]|uniref:LexA family protein n=1 Tax=Legionella sp. TaxID=459 RepID=UPI0039E5A56F